jgi:hypothetical protein
MLFATVEGYFMVDLSCQAYLTLMGHKELG